MMKSRLHEISFDSLFIILGSIFCAVAMDVFLIPNHIVAGGFTGIATVINYLVPQLSVGMMIIALNIPLFIISGIKLGWLSLIKTAIAMTLSSVLIDIGSTFATPYSDNILLAAVFGGLCYGAGLGMIYTRGATTGGSDLVGKLIGRKLQHIPFGKLLLAVDSVVVIFATIVFNDLTSGLYAIITIYSCSVIIDKILVGLDVAKIAYISTNKTDEITEDIIKVMDRTVTILNATGGYSKKDKPMIMCVVRNIEIPKLKKIIFSYDADAFVVFSNSNEVLGEGFKQANNL